MKKIPIRYKMITPDGEELLLIAKTLKEAKLIVEKYAADTGCAADKFVVLDVDKNENLYDAIALKPYKNIKGYPTDDDAKADYIASLSPLCCGYFIDGYSRAIVGFSEEGRVVYDYDRLIEVMMEDDGCTEEDARDWYDFNIERSFPYYKPSPIVIRSQNY